MQGNKLQKFVPMLFLCFVAFSTILVAGIKTTNITTNNNGSAKSDVIVTALGDNRIKLTYTPEVNFDTVEVVNMPGKYLLPVINSTFFNSLEVGIPIKKQRSYKLNISGENSFLIEDLSVHNIRKIYGKIAPVPTLEREDSITIEKYIYFPDKYHNAEKNIFDWVDVKYAGVSRGQHLASVIFSPIKFNSKTEIIEIPEKIDIIIKLNTTTTTNINNISNKLLYEYSNRQNLDELSDGIWYRIGIKDEGVYRLTASDLSDKGINIPIDKIKTIKIFGRSGRVLDESVSSGKNNILQEQEILVATKKDGSLEHITFYASGISGITTSKLNNFKYPTHYSNYMDNNNYYLITYGGTEGKRANISNNQLALELDTLKPIHKPRNYIATIYNEEDLIMPYFWGGGKIWLGPSLNNFSVVHTLHNLSRNSTVQNITYIFSMAHVSERDASFDFKFGNNSNLSYRLNIKSSTGSYVAATLGTSDYFDFPIDAVSPDNRVVLNVEYTGATSGIPYLNYYELHYPREFVPIDGEITFFSDTNLVGLTEYNINGFTGNIFGFDVTDESKPKLLYNNSSTGGMFVFKTNVLENTNNRYFIASKIKKPIVFEKIEMDNLRGKDANADVIIITHESLLPSARKFAEYRHKQSGYKTTVVSTNKIYNEFSHSRYDVTAIRDYIQYSYNNWTNKPQYVILWGMGHYDYRGIEYKINNFVPAYQYDTQLERIRPGNFEKLTDNQQCYATDEFYVCVDGEDWFSDLAIGRVPITSNEQGEIYISKLDNYEKKSDNSNWRNNIILLADDDVTTSGFEGAGYHSKDAEEISRRIPSDFNQTKIYAVVYPVEIQGGARRKPMVTQELLNTTNVTGASILFYTGHGNPNRLMHEDVLLREVTLNQFNNSNKLFYFMASSCEVGRFDKSGSNCIGTEIVTLPKTGAIASISATRVSGIRSNTDFYCFLYDSLFSRDDSGEFITIGEASKIAKLRYGGSAPTPEALMYVLLGDPTLRLVFPKDEIVATSINKIDLQKDSTQVVDVKALSEINVTGKIVDITTGEKLNDFNGAVILTLDESQLDIIYQCEHGENDKHKFKQKGATINKSTFPVNSGEFNAKFIVPGDISFSEENAILYLYAFSNDSSKFAKGVTNRLRINDIDASVPNDNNGPEISIYLDSKLYFNRGDAVSNTPLLLVDISDETGINTTGLGIGHRIEAWLDDNPNPIDLTPRYVSSMTNPNAGSISQYLYGLNSGKHTIRVRAWDVFNNYGIGETDFIIPSDDGEVFYLTFGPNPALRSGLANVNLILRHNFIPPVELEIILFDALGNIIPSVGNKNNIISKSSEEILIFENLFDITKIVPGTYYYKIRCAYNSGKNIYEKFGSVGIVLD